VRSTRPNSLTCWPLTKPAGGCGLLSPGAAEPVLDLLGLRGDCRSLLPVRKACRKNMLATVSKLCSFWMRSMVSQRASVMPSAPEQAISQSCFAASKEMGPLVAAFLALSSKSQSNSSSSSSAIPQSRPRGLLSRCCLFLLAASGLVLSKRPWRTVHPQQGADRAAAFTAGALSSYWPFASDGRQERAARQPGRHRQYPGTTALAASSSALVPVDWERDPTGGLRAGERPNWSISNIQALVAQEMGVALVNDVSGDSNNRFVSCASGVDVWDEMDEVYSSEGTSVEVVVDAIVHLSKVHGSLDQYVWGDPRYRQFVAEALRVLGAAEEFSPEDVGRLLDNIGKLQVKLPDTVDLLRPIYSKFPEVAYGMKLQDALGSLRGIVDTEEEVPQARRAVQPVLQIILNSFDEMEPRDLVCVLASVGKLYINKLSLKPLLDLTMPRLTLELLEELTLRDVATLTWALSQLGEKDDALLGNIVAVATKKMHKDKNKQVLLYVPTIVCAFRRLRYEDHVFNEAFALLLKNKGGMLRKMGDWHLAAMKWALPELPRRSATAEADDKATTIPLEVRLLIEKLNVQVERRKMTSQEVSTSWYGPEKWAELALPLRESRMIKEQRERQRVQWNEQRAEQRAPQRRPDEREGSYAFEGR